MAQPISDKRVLKLIRRFLQAGLMENGLVSPVDEGTPQGGPRPQVPFERYADDVITHCRTERQAQAMRTAIAARLQFCGLELHPEKTKIVYCKDDFRKGTYPNEKFDFLRYTFRPRRSKNHKGRYFINFSPGFEPSSEGHPRHDSQLASATTQ